MRKFICAVAVSITAFATPTAASGNLYIGVEAGGMLIEDASWDQRDNRFGRTNDAYELNHKAGLDADIIVGYDVGPFRIEGELGYKHARIDDVVVSSAISGGAGSDFDTDGHSSAVSLMLNGLLDFPVDRWVGYVGAGVGAARVTTDFAIPDLGTSVGGKRGRFAWQAIAGVRTAVSAVVDVGVKYRYFNVPNLDPKGDGPSGPFDLDGRWRSHTLLVSLIYNIVPTPPPPPLPPPLLEAPPPEPPPPPPTPSAPERG